MKCLSRVAMCVIALSAVMVSCSLTEIKCPGETDCGGVCADLSKDNDHCGECGHACQSGEKCVDGECVISCVDGQVECDGACVNIQTDANHCGDCGVVCEDIQSCVSGVCVCPEGTMLCDSKCLDFEKLSLDSCTACKQGFCNPNGDKALGCKSIEDLHVTACSPEDLTCDSSHLDCDGRISNGCETEIGNENCEGCGLPCGSGKICINGSCEVTCAESETNCEGRCLNLAELHRSTCEKCADGYCDNGNLFCDTMGLLHVTSCVGEKIECEKDYLDCDGDFKNGCEVNKNSNENCGACGNKCSDGKVCSNGECATTCGAGLQICEDACINLSEFHLEDCSTCITDYCDADGNINRNGCEAYIKGSDIDNCGACGKKCDVENADNYCYGGVCKFQCHEGFHVYNDICEADSVEHCGGHDKKCDIDHGKNIKCESAGCTFTCEKGYHNYKDTCEMDSKENCGLHGKSCHDDHGTGECSDGKCSLTCDVGYHVYGDICEQDTIVNCGSHGKMCSVVQGGITECKDAQCVTTCKPGFTLIFTEHGTACESLCQKGYFYCEKNKGCCTKVACAGACMMAI